MMAPHTHTHTSSLPLFVLARIFGRVVLARRWRQNSPLNASKPFPPETWLYIHLHLQPVGQWCVDVSRNRKPSYWSIAAAMYKLYFTLNWKFTIHQSSINILILVWGNKATRLIPTFSLTFWLEWTDGGSTKRQQRPQNKSFWLASKRQRQAVTWFERSPKISPWLKTVKL